MQFGKNAHTSLNFKLCVVESALNPGGQQKIYQDFWQGIKELLFSGLAIKKTIQKKTPKKKEKTLLKKHLLVDLLNFWNAVKLACIQQVRTYKIHRAYK